MRQLPCQYFLVKFQHYHDVNVISLLQVHRAINGWTHLQKSDDNIEMVMLKFGQKMLAWKLSHPLNLENEIFKRSATMYPVLFLRQSAAHCIFVLISLMVEIIVVNSATFFRANFIVDAAPAIRFEHQMLQANIFQKI